MNSQHPPAGARGFFTTIVRGWAIILGLTVLAALGTLGYCWLQDPEYKANATVYVTSGTSSMASTWDGVKSSQDRMATYARLVYSDAVLAPAIAAAGLDMPINKAREAVEVEVDPLITTMTVSATDNDPLVAQNLANAVSDSLADAVATLDVPSGGGSPAARVTVINSAQVEEDPVWPKPLIFVPIAAAIGLVVGLLLVLALERLNNRVRDERDAQVALDTRTLAVIPANADKVIDFETDTSAAAESFRALRTSFTAGTQETPVRRLVVTSARGGSEKTTTAVNLAAALAHAGNLVVAIDGDLADRELSRITGIRTEAGLVDVLSGRVSLDSVLMPTKSDNLAVIGAGSQSAGVSTDLLASKEFGRLLTELAARFEYVVIDSAAVLGSVDALASAGWADGVLLVVRRKARLSDLRTVRERLKEVNANLVGMVYCNFTKAAKQEAAEPPAGNGNARRVADDDQTRRTRTAANRI
jgi:capsular exopolysaccharide synthesis family protein